MSNISTPYGGPSYAEHRRAAQAIGADADRCDLVSSSVFGIRVAPWQSPTGRDHPLPEWPTFRPAYLSVCSRPTRLSSCWRSTGFMLAEHRLYLETECHEGHRANFSSADLTGRDFSGLNQTDVWAFCRPCGLPYRLLFLPYDINDFFWGISCQQIGRRRALVTIVNGSTERAKTRKICSSQPSNPHVQTYQHLPRMMPRQLSTNLDGSHVSSRFRRWCR